MKCGFVTKEEGTLPVTSVRVGKLWAASTLLKAMSSRDSNFVAANNFSSKSVLERSDSRPKK